MAIAASALTAQFYLQPALFADSIRKNEYIAEVNAAKALIENTTAKVVPIVGDPSKKKSVKIFWNKFCNTDVSNAAPDFCDIQGTEPDSDVKEYEISLVASKKFTIDAKKYETNYLNVEEVLADLMLKTKKALDEAITQVLVSTLDGFSAPNLYTTKGIGCPGAIGPDNWASTYIEPTKWTPEIMHYFSTVARINKFSTPFLLDGKNLAFKSWESMMNAANANGAGSNKMMSLFKYYEDLVNVEAVSPGKTFMVDAGSCAFASRNLWGGYKASNPLIERGGRIKYSEPSMNIPGLNYDVYVTEECSDEYTKDNFLVVANYDLFNGAENCNGQSGVLEFVCGACPT